MAAFIAAFFMSYKIRLRKLSANNAKDAKKNTFLILNFRVLCVIRGLFFLPAASTLQAQQHCNPPRITSCLFRIYPVIKKHIREERKTRENTFFCF